MHDTKVNTNNSDGTSADGKNDLPVQYVGRDDPAAVELNATYIVDLSKVDQGSFRTYPKGDVVLSGLVLQAPLYMVSTTLGFDGTVWIDIVDSTGLRVTTHCVEPLFQLIEHFHERDRESFLASAAVHYGFDDVRALIKGRYE